MKRLFVALLGVLILGLLVQQSAVAQQTPPNLQAVRDSISNPSSSLYYPVLFNRYQMMDSTLTMTDYYYLYYGYPEQLTYMPLLDNSAKIELEQIMGKRSAVTVDDYQRAIVLAQTILSVEPFNMRDINVLAFLYAQVGYDDKAAHLMQRIDMIANTIRSTGDGKREETAWWVTYFNHAVDLLALMNCDQQTPIIVSRSVEFIPVSNMENRKDKGYYFNYSEVYAHGADYLKDYSAPKRKFDLKSWDSDKDFRL